MQNGFIVVYNHVRGWLNFISGIDVEQTTARFAQYIVFMSRETFDEHQTAVNSASNYFTNLPINKKILMVNEQKFLNLLPCCAEIYAAYKSGEGVNEAFRVLLIPKTDDLNLILNRIIALRGAFTEQILSIRHYVADEDDEIKEPIYFIQRGRDPNEVIIKQKKYNKTFGKVSADHFYYYPSHTYESRVMIKMNKLGVVNTIANLREAFPEIKNKNFKTFIIWVNLPDARDACEHISPGGHI